MSLPKLPPAPVHTTELQRANRTRMLQFLREECPPEQFDFRYTVKEDDGHCGTVCCAIGWTPRLFPEQVKWCSGLGSVEAIDDPKCRGFLLIGPLLFGLPDSVSAIVFVPDGRGPDGNLPYCGDRATPQQVADRLEFAFALYP